MSEYILILRIPEIEIDYEIRYSATLIGLHESYPEDYFRFKKKRLHLQESLQQQLGKPISATDVDNIIVKWIPDIKSGLHHTTITLNLSPTSKPLLDNTFSKVNLPAGSGYQPNLENIESPSSDHASPSTDISTNQSYKVSPTKETYSSSNLPPPEGATTPPANIPSRVESIVHRETSPPLSGSPPAASLVRLASGSQGLDSVVGLEQIKTWFRSLQPMLGQNKEIALPPYSLLLEGLPGCGKNMIASAIAQELKLSQLKLDLSWLDLHSEQRSGENLSSLLEIIANLSPNVLLIDGLERFQVNTDSTDIALDSPILEAFLTWFKGHQCPIFSIVIAQDQDKLPLKLIHTNFFDASFIVLPPNQKERSEIIHKRVQKHQLPPISPHILGFVIAETAGYFRTELNQLVQEVVCLAGVGHLPTEKHWQQALSKIEPQFRCEDMQQLLKKYMRLLEQNHSRPASQIETGFLERLILL